MTNWATPRTWTVGQIVTAAELNQDIRDNINALAQKSVSFWIDGGGAVISTDSAGWWIATSDFTIREVRLKADQVGDVVVDIRRPTTDSDATVAASDSLTAAATPTLSCDIYTRDATLTGWTTSILEGDQLYFYVESAVAIERCLVALFMDQD